VQHPAKKKESYHRKTKARLDFHYPYSTIGKFLTRQLRCSQRGH
jgi:hypothetical protein